MLNQPAVRILARDCNDLRQFLINFIGNAIKFAAQEADSLSIKSDCSFLPH